jgi:hypothetical protein
MRSCRFVNNSQLLLASAFALASPGTAFANATNRLPKAFDRFNP